MKCAVHTDVDATGYCRNCGKPMCAACARPIRDVLYCEDCLATGMGHSAPAPPPVDPPPPGAPAASIYAPPPPVTAAMPMALPSRSSSPGVAFFLGLFPGLGAVYNGQYNKALIYIVLFVAMVIGASNASSGGLTAGLILLVIGFGFYSAFEAMRTAQAKNLGEIPSDPLESWSKDRPLGPIILIGLGVLFLLDNFNIFDRFHFGQFWPLILIAVGVYMFRNKLGGR
jgi:Domain of unknown function (DUF5668)/B-box zinc finger